MTRRLLLRPAFALLVLFLPVAGASEGATAERWYENLRAGQKTGWIRVVWAPSTWRGKKTVHDSTTITYRSVRDMLGMKDEFEIVSTTEIERGEDGTLWWMRTEAREAERLTVSEVTWTETGYEIVNRIGDSVERVSIPAGTPASVDAEAFLGPRVRDGTLGTGERVRRRTLDERARSVREFEIEVLEAEEVEGEAGPVLSTKVRETDPESGHTTVFWLDGEGAVVQLKDDGGGWVRRAKREAAETRPAVPAEMSITTPSFPPLERIFSADRVLLDLHLQGDPDRRLPEFPDSPWSRVLDRRGDDESGWVFRIELKKYDSEAAAGVRPVTDPAFARDLEPTVLMEVGDPRVVARAAAIVGEETDLRRSAHLLARWVYENLTKQSLEVQQGSAVEILERCRGDCSEHALLFVALCRAAGIPARLCSGYVNVGSAWGAHSWAEIWTGQWIAADPTTGEVGGAARYLFFGYPDRPGSFPGVVSSRAQGRMRFVIARVEEGGQAYDLGIESSTWMIADREHGRFVNVLTGLEAREVPSDWIVRLSPAGMQVRAKGLVADIRAGADQGSTLENLGGMGTRTTFAGAPALVQELGAEGSRFYVVWSRRRTVTVRVDAEDPESLGVLEKILAPTFAAVPPPFEVPSGGDEPPPDEE